MILLRPICWMLGHKRGRFLAEHKPAHGEGWRRFACPRCGHRTEYKLRNPTLPNHASPGDQA